MLGTWGGALGAGLLLLFFQVCGLCMAHWAFPGESTGARALLGSVCGSVMLQWFPIPFAFFLGFSVPAHFCGAGLALACAGLCLWVSRRGGVSSGKFRRGIPGLWGLFRRRKFLWVVLALTLFYWFLVWKSFLFSEGKIFSSQATYGDMSMHLSFITSLARQQAFPPDYSLLPGVRLSYPFLSDSVSSSLYLLGAPLKLAYFLPMALAGAQVFFGFYLFASRLLGSLKKGAFAWILFFFNGGLGFVYFLNGERSFSDLLWGFYQTPTNLVEKGIRWVNVVVDMMLPQRATLFGWAVLFPALYLLYRAAFEKEKRYFLYAGVLAGLMPMIHTHSFLVFALVCGVWLCVGLIRALSLERYAIRAGKLLVLIGLCGMAALYAGTRSLTEETCFLWAALVLAVIFFGAVLLLLWRAVRKTGWKPWLSTWGVLFLTACALALPQLFTWTFRQAGTGGFIRGHLGWSISQGEDGYLVFYLKNLGLGALLALGGLLSAKDEAFGRFSPALAIWLLAELVQFQPNVYDNNKLLYPAYGFLCCAGAEFGAKLLKKLKSRPVRSAAAAACLLLCTVSAVLTMGRESVARYELFGEGALALCGYVEENTPADAVILTDLRHNNEIASLSGRNVVCGSPAYLFYHGLPYQGNQLAAQEMYERPRQSLELFKKYGVDYVLVSDFEQSSYAVDEQALADLFPKVYDDGVRKLYQVSGD